MKIILIACVAMLFIGCANKIDVKCPSCTITSTEGNLTYDCKECTIEASGTEDFSFISIPGRE